MSPHKAASVLSWGPLLGRLKPLGRGQPSAGSPAYLVCYPRFATALRPETSALRGDHPTHQKIAQLLSWGPSLGRLKSLGRGPPRARSPAYLVCYPRFATALRAETSVLRGDHPTHQKIAQLLSWGPSLGRLKSLGYEAPQIGSPAYLMCSNAALTRARRPRLAIPP